VAFKKRLLLLIILCELIIILILLTKMNRTTSLFILPIDKSQLIVNEESSNLKFFYEPAPLYYHFYQNSTYGESLVVQTNEDTLYERYNYTLNKTRTYRIITLGDSFTQCEGMNISFCYSEVLEDMLNQNCDKKFDVINLGVGGYDIEYMVERLKVRGLKYKPDVVLILIKSDDFEVINEIWRPILSKIHLPDAIVDKNHYQLFYSYIKNAWNNYTREIDRLSLDEKFNDTIEFYINYNYPKLKELANMARENNFKLVIHTFLISEEYVKILEKLSDNFKIFLFDLEIPKDVYFKNLTFGFDAHPNKIGQLLIAQKLFNYIISQNIVPCN
jgi:hypothetical protein